MNRLCKLVAPALASVLLFGCGGGSSKPNGGGGAGAGVGGQSGSGTFNPNNLNCSSATANCTDAELAPFQNCIVTSCGPGLDTCYGPGYMTGQFAGACGTYAACISKCSCSDNTCRTACGVQPTACATCLSSSLTTCALSCFAQLPACATGGGQGGAAGGLGGASGAATCLVQVATCCAAATAQTACLTEYGDLVGMGTLAETACGVKLAGFKATYCP